MADLLSDNGFPGKKIGYIQKQSITCRLYSPEKKLMFYIQQMHQHFQFIADNLNIRTRIKMVGEIIRSMNK